MLSRVTPTNVLDMWVRYTLAWAWPLESSKWYHLLNQIYFLFCHWCASGKCFFCLCSLLGLKPSWPDSRLAGSPWLVSARCIRHRAWAPDHTNYRSTPSIRLGPCGPGGDIHRFWSPPASVAWGRTDVAKLGQGSKEMMTRAMSHRSLSGTKCLLSPACLWMLGTL